MKRAMSIGTIITEQTVTSDIAIERMEKMAENAPFALFVSYQNPH